MADPLRTHFRRQQAKRLNREIKYGILSEKSSPERIADALEPNHEGMCDDCLSIAADVTPRQQVNQICRGLAERGIVKRAQVTCPVCGRQKLVNLPLSQGMQPSASADRNDVPALLDQYRRKIVDVLNRIEDKTGNREGIATRAARLREDKKLPSAVACMMLTLNSLRNLVVYEGFVPGRHELAVIEAAWASIEHWRDVSIKEGK